MNDLNLSRKVLKAAPKRVDWQEPATYASVYLLNSRQKHDSGWGLIRIIGRKEDGSLEDAGWCDDICWKHAPSRHYTMRTDMTFPSGAVHCWGWNTTFTVGAALSSTDISVNVNNDKPA